MKTKGMKDALTRSLKAEDDSVRNRFEVAESLLSSSNLTLSGESSLPPSDKQSLPTVIRDSFTLPEGDYEKFTDLKDRFLGLARNVTKSEIVRAGLYALEQLPDTELLSIVEKLEKVKTGRRSLKK